MQSRITVATREAAILRLEDALDALRLAQSGRAPEQHAYSLDIVAQFHAQQVAQMLNIPPAYDTAVQ